MQYSIDIATEQSFRYIEHTDAKSGFPKMHHYVGFWQIGSYIVPLVSPRVHNIYELLILVSQYSDILHDTVQCVLVGLVYGHSLYLFSKIV